MERNVIRLVSALIVFILLCGCLASAEESEEFYETYTVEPDTCLLVSNYQAGGDVKTTTLKAFTKEEFVKIVRGLP